MIGITNLSHMTLFGWKKRYLEILKEFRYNKKRDSESAKILNSLLKNKISLSKLRKMIHDQDVFVIGAGPTLQTSIITGKK